MLPFLKWPGGKRWFAARAAQFLPSTYGRYIEPFLGSGALYFHLEPSVALLGDANGELIATYKAIRSDPQGVRRHLRTHHQQHNLHGPKYYYRMRDKESHTPTTRAARFLYLNRTCFNGIYRVNLNGVFNVPIGTKSAVVLDTDDFVATSRLLQTAELVPEDFQVLIDRAESGDLVFADPPYTVRHNNNGFVKYNETLFSWECQLRLAKALKRAVTRGVKVVATNAAHDEIRDLYPERTFRLTKESRYSSISSNSASRSAYSEYVIQSRFK